MLDLMTLLKALPVIGPLASAVPAVKSLIDGAITAMHPTDQAHAKQALADIMRENDEGHARLQEKLATAGRR